MRVLLSQLIALGVASCAWAQSDDYRTVVVFGDTQSLVHRSHPEPTLRRMVDWVIAQRDRERIDLVLHVGDAISGGLVLPAPECADAMRAVANHESCQVGERDCPTDPPPDGCLLSTIGRKCFSCELTLRATGNEWERFMAEWERLRPDPGTGWAGVPYAITRGRHDNLGQPGPIDVAAPGFSVDQIGFTQQFGPAHWRELEAAFRAGDRALELVEFCPPEPRPNGESCAVDDVRAGGDALPAYALRVRIGERDALVLVASSEFAAEGQDAWIRGVLRRNADTPAILLAHYLSSRPASQISSARIYRLATEPEFAARFFMLANGHLIRTNLARIYNIGGERTLRVIFNNQDQRGPAARYLLLLRFRPGSVEAVVWDPVGDRRVGTLLTPAPLDW